MSKWRFISCLRYQTINKFMIERSHNFFRVKSFLHIIPLLICLLLFLCEPLYGKDHDSSNNFGGIEDPDTIFYDFSSGIIDWYRGWDTNGGNDDHRGYYRVDRLRGGYLIRNHQSYHSNSAHDYFIEQVNQIIKPCDQNGFWDMDNENWIKSLLWSRTDGWHGALPHDWKYSIELEEGALMAAMISGNSKMDFYLAKELEYIHAHIADDGTVEGLDLNENIYEYGLILSSLALSARYFDDRHVVGLNSLSDTAYADMKKVDNYIKKNCEPLSCLTKGLNTLLRGLANTYHAYHEYNDPVREKCILMRMEDIISLFIENQEACGRFRIYNPAKDLYPVQEQLKADIAIMLTYKINGDGGLLTVVKNNLDWVVKHRWDTSEKDMCGIIWSAEDTTSFFECHQMWFLIASKYLEDESEYDCSSYRADALAFLTDDNFASVDTYVHNFETYGTFFSYRAISSDGTIQKEPSHQFKGAYEIGASLWAMALNYDFYDEGHTWLITQSPKGETTGWDKAIFSEKNFGNGNMRFQWDVKFRDIDSEGACSGLFNDQCGDWRILFDTASGIHYKNIFDCDVILVDKSLLRSNVIYTLQIIKSSAYKFRFILSENGRVLHNSEIMNVKKFDSCYFGALQRNYTAAAHNNIYIDNIKYGTRVEAPDIQILRQNFPNPFNSRTTIEFNVPMKSRVKLNVFDLEGKLVRSLVDATLESSNYSISWDGRNGSGNNMESGIYFYRLEIGNFHYSKKMVLLE